MPRTKRSLVLPASPPSVKLARSWVSKILEEIGREDLVDAAQLGVSELVTNAHQHTASPVVSVLTAISPLRLRVAVVDSCPTPMPEPACAGTLAEPGRGLMLLQSLASRWGWRVREGNGRPPGKAVWFELAPDPT